MSKDMENKITLYPSNWLYNAGVVGLLQVLEASDIKVADLLENDGSFDLDKLFFGIIKIKNKEIPKAIYAYSNFLVSEDELVEWLNKEDNNNQTNKDKYQAFCEDMGNFGYKFVRAGNKLFASKTPYQNLVQLSEWQSYEFSNLAQEIPYLMSSSSAIKCGLCLKNPVKITDPNSKLQERLTKLQITHLKELGPSIGEFPNGFWNCNQSISLCYLCVYLIIHHHLALTTLQDKSQIFINAPSFNILYHLNKFVREIYTKEEARDIRQLLGMSVIEYATKIQVTLGVWTGMNIEVVSKYGKKIEFFSLPYEVIQLISTREIAAALSDIGEFKILNLVLNQEYSKLVEIGYRLLRVSLSEKPNYDLINSWLFQNKNKGNKLNNTANKILKLYALIEQKPKKEVKV